MSISSIVKSCFLQLHDFRHILPFISKTAVFELACALVHSRLNFCNSIVYGPPEYSIHRLQRVQHTVARTVTNSSHFLHKGLTNSSHFSHVTPTLKSLHWLRIFYRSNFKICCITHCALYLGKLFYFNT